MKGLTGLGWFRSSWGNDLSLACLGAGLVAGFLTRGPGARRGWAWRLVGGNEIAWVFQLRNWCCCLRRHSAVEISALTGGGHGLRLRVGKGGGLESGLRSLRSIERALIWPAMMPLVTSWLRVASSQRAVQDLVATNV